MFCEGLDGTPYLIDDAQTTSNVVIRGGWPMLRRLPKWMLESGLPKMPLAEKCYRQFWWRKGDVYRMLMSLQNIIDGSTWPSQDKRRVHELVGLIHHVTGVSSQMPSALNGSSQGGTLAFFAASLSIHALHDITFRTCALRGGVMTTR